MKRKVVFSILVVVLFFVALGYLFSRESLRPEEGIINNEDSAPAKESTPGSYQILNISKKDGEIFSIPETISYTLSSNLTHSTLTVLDANNQSIFVSSTKDKNAQFVIYPEGRIAEGTMGELVIEGFIDSKSVVKKAIKIKF